MHPQHGSFIWYELLTSDLSATAKFYRAVIGWEFGGDGDAEMGYRMILADGEAVGGVLPLQPQMIAGGARPGWLGYIGVEDVDTGATAIAADGGQLLMPPFDIPGYGRAAMVADPQGNPFYIMRGSSPENSRAYQRMGYKHVSWNELNTADDAAGLAFYAKHFGHRTVGAMPMGPMGDYSFIATTESGDAPIGAVMRVQPEGAKGWNFYIRVPDVYAARERLVANGGTVIDEPQEVPGDEVAMFARDPGGAPFGLVGPK